MRLLKVSLFAILPIYLSAGFFDWFYTSPDKVSHFECPHHCGAWGTEGVRQVEWKALLVMWELDRFAQAIQGSPFSYSEIPRAMNDPWVHKFKQEGLSLEVRIATRKVVKPRYNRVFYLEEESWDGCSEGWGISWYMDEEGNYKGIELFSDLRLYENNKEFDSYDLSYQFDSMKEVQDFCFDIQTTLKDRLLNDSYYYWCRCDEEAIEVINTHERITEIINKRLKENERLIDRHSQAGFRMKNLMEKREDFAKDSEKNNRELEEAKGIREGFTATKDRIQTSMEIYYPWIESRLGDLKQAYCSIFDHCIAHHNAPEAYYQRALYHYSEGLNINCIEDIKKLFEMTPPEMFTEEMRAKLEFRKGKAECELDLFEDAIHTLSQYIGAYPHRREAYLERAIAYLEKGNVPEALQDFIDSRHEMRPIEHSNVESFEYAKGLMKGIGKGALETLDDAGSFLISSVSGISHGIIALSIAPQETSREFVSACQEVMTVIKENGVINTLIPRYPELQEVFSREPLSPSREGELIGQVIGHLGVDYALLKGGVKAVKAVRRLRQANAILTLESMSKSIQVEQQMINHTREWWNRSAPIIEEMRAAKERQLGTDLYKAFRHQSLSEPQVRKILHHAGFETFPRPKGVPNSWTVKLSKRKGGMKYRFLVPGKKGEVKVKAELRVMPGDPNAKWPSQRGPYVMHQVNGNCVNKYGKIVSRESREAHIPLEQYNFETLTGIIPHD
ncbi:MAG: hypothetical protein KFB93_04145 [Simkaniaceae bacterium]|nr:MAG: hypothetical protein KFB93_04145 [Simkaniaceae bacterium]